MTTTHVALIAGAMLTGGLTMVVVGLLPTRPDLTAVVRQHLPDPDTPTARVAAQSGVVGWVRSVALPAVADRSGLGRFAADLRLLDRDVTSLAAQKVGYGLLGLVFPPLVLALMALAGVRAPGLVPVAAGLVVGGVLFVLPDQTIRRDAATERAGLRQATGAYIELVALERLADAGPTEALHRAAEISASPHLARIRDALTRAELAGRPTWAGLADLAQHTGVVELADLADIMAVAGRDGAAVYTTLRARAASLRTQLLTAQVSDANAASERMVIPVSALGLCFMALIAYPAFVRILFT